MAKRRDEVKVGDVIHGEGGYHVKVTRVHDDTHPKHQAAGDERSVELRGVIHADPNNLVPHLIGHARAETGKASDLIEVENG